jgi:hypothetical protein
MNPLMSLALAHAEPSSLHPWEGVGVQVDEDKPQPIRGGGQWTVLVGRLSASGARLPIETPVGHMRLEGRLKGRDHALKRIPCETGHIQHRRGAGLDVGEA